MKTSFGSKQKGSGDQESRGAAVDMSFEFMFVCMCVYQCIKMHVRLFICGLKILRACFAFNLCIVMFVRLPQHHLVQQRVTPCQHSNLLTILPYPQVKHEVVRKKKL